MATLAEERGFSVAVDTDVAIYGNSIADSHGRFAVYQSRDATSAEGWSVVPAPGALWLLGTGCVGLFGWARRKAAA